MTLIAAAAAAAAATAAVASEDGARAGGGRMIWYALGALPAVIAAVLLVVVLVLWLYPPQVRFIARPWRWLLPGLRALALAMLAVSVLKPAVRRARAAVEQDPILVLVDRSQSMSVADAGARPPEQWVALADALGALPAGTQRRDPAAGFDATLDALRRDAEIAHARRADLELARLQPERLEQARAEADDAMRQFKADLSSLMLPSQLFARQSDVAASVNALAQVSADLPADAWYEQVRFRLERAQSAFAALRAAADRELYESDGGVRRACDELARRSRAELAWLGLNSPKIGLRDLLGGDEANRLFEFGASAQPAAWPPNVAWASSSSASGSAADAGLPHTDIAASLRSAAAQMRGGRTARAFVVLTDGRDTASADDARSPAEGAAAAGAGAAAVGGSADGGDDVRAPVFAINVAPPAPPTDVSIARITVPQRQFVGENFVVRVDLRQQGLSGTAVDVRISSAALSPANAAAANSTGKAESNAAGAAGGVTDASAPQQLQQRIVLSDDPVIPVEFTLKADATPEQRIDVSVDPVAGEITAKNNRARRWVNVISQPLKVAAFSGSPAWDFQYLRNTLSRTRWVLLREAILSSEAMRLPLTPAQILDQDVIVLNDLPAGSLGAEQWKAVQQFVTARGGSLILIAGDGHLPAEYGQTELLASLLPYRGGLKPVWRVWPGPTPSFQLVPAPGTETIDALRLSDDPVEGRQRWNVLPGWFRYLSIAELKGNTRPLVIERDSKAPVLTESRLGLGRVLFFGGNETWRWRYKAGEAIQDRFWLQLVRYAAGEAYAVNNGHGASLDLETLAPEPGRAIEVRARVRRDDDDGAPSPDAQQVVRLLRNGQELLRQKMDVVGGGIGGVVGGAGSGRYQTLLAMPPDEGDCEVELLVDPPVRLQVHVQRSSEAEMSNLAGDSAALRRLARRTGGELLPLERLSELPDLLLRSRAIESTRIVEYPLWDSPYLFVFVVACLGTEWALRKSLGLA